MVGIVSRLVEVDIDLSKWILGTGCAMTARCHTIDLSNGPKAGYRSRRNKKQEKIRSNHFREEEKDATKKDRESFLFERLGKGRGKDCK